MSTLAVTDSSLANDVIAHLDAQLLSARRLLQVVLEQGAAIRARDCRRRTGEFHELSTIARHFFLPLDVPPPN